MVISNNVPLMQIGILRFPKKINLKLQSETQG